jgi:quinol monooxygenase YgiN
MPNQDSCCSLVPYFNVNPNQLGAFKELCEQFIDKTKQEPKCLYYGFSFSADQAHCREGYEDAAALLNHLDNVGALLDQLLEISTIVRLEVHGPQAELDKLREPLAALTPVFFELEDGFRR